MLEGLTRVPGVRGALVVSLEDGLVVGEASMAGVDAPAAAALAGSLAVHTAGAATAVGFTAPGVIHLEAADGGLLAIPLADGLLLMAIADSDANVGLLKLALRHAGERIA
jgi:predicted regulator of Ras-like GTPase activity (Roadblock/LC7/MglB family)